eukprot:gene8328-biopygen16621
MGVARAIGIFFCCRRSRQAEVQERSIICNFIIRPHCCQQLTDHSPALIPDHHPAALIPDHHPAALIPDHHPVALIPDHHPHDVHVHVHMCMYMYTTIANQSILQNTSKEHLSTWCTFTCSSSVWNNWREREDSEDQSGKVGGARSTSVGVMLLKPDPPLARPGAPMPRVCQGWWSASAHHSAVW